MWLRRIATVLLTAMLLCGTGGRTAPAQSTAFTVPPGGRVLVSFEAYCLDFGGTFPPTVTVPSSSAGLAPTNVRSSLNYIRSNRPKDSAAALQAQYAIWRDLYWLTDYAGQSVAEPPNVAGWPAYYLYPSYDDIWLDTATYPARNFSLLGLTYGGLNTDAQTYQPQSSALEFKYDFVAFTQLLSNPSDPNVLISELAELMFGVAVSQTVRDQLKTNYLLFGQSVDYYWTLAYDTYVADPGTTDMAEEVLGYGPAVYVETPQWLRELR